MTAKEFMETQIIISEMARNLSRINFEEFFKVIDNASAAGVANAKAPNEIIEAGQANFKALKNMGAAALQLLVSSETYKESSQHFKQLMDAHVKTQIKDRGLTQSLGDQLKAKLANQEGENETKTTS